MVLGVAISPYCGFNSPAIVSLEKRKTQISFANKALLTRLTPTQSIFKPIIKLLIFCLVIVLIALALVNPKIGTKLETVKREGVDIVFAVDVSKSMLAEDIAPNRLEKAKQLVTQIINNLASDRVGIIAYAGKAFPQLPITTDYASAKNVFAKHEYRYAFLSRYSY